MAYFHVRITVENQRHDELKVDIDETTLERQFLEPYWDGRPIVVNGKTIPIGDVSRIRISSSETPINEIVERIRFEDQTSKAVMLGGPSITWRAAARAHNVTDEFITGPPGSIADAATSQGTTSPGSDGETYPAGDDNSVFIVAGRDNKAISALVAVLRAMNVKIVEWDHAVARTGLPSPYVGEVVAAGLAMAKAAVVVITPDDLVMLRSDLQNDGDRDEERRTSGQARPNVIYEAGYADAIGRDRTVIVEIGNPKPFTDLSGRHTVRYDGSAAKRNVLAERLRNAGVVVDTSGEEWHKVGDLAPALQAAREALAREAVEAGHAGLSRTDLTAQLDALLDSYQTMVARSQYDDLSDLKAESLELVIKAQAFIDGFASGSTYASEAGRVMSEPAHIRIPVLIAVLRSLRDGLDT